MQRLGSVKDINLDIRIIAATNRELPQMIKEGAFREDLYYRLNVINIDLPPLAERRGDIMLLARTFIERFARKTGKKVAGVSPEAAELLLNYQWPGNVRELENIIERAVVLTRGDVIDRVDLAGLTGRATPPVPADEILPLADVEKRHIESCLRHYNWNMSLCAEKLGIHRNTLRSKIREYSLKQD